jgi:hypothetical protein
VRTAGGMDFMLARRAGRSSRRSRGASRASRALSAADRASRIASSAARPSYQTARYGSLQVGSSREDVEHGTCCTTTDKAHVCMHMSLTAILQLPMKRPNISEVTCRDVDLELLWPCTARNTARDDSRHSAPLPAAMPTSLRELAEALPAAVSAARGSIDGRIFCVCRRTLLRRSSGRPCWLHWLTLTHRHHIYTRCRMKLQAATWHGNRQCALFEQVCRHVCRSQCAVTT